jgi:hypothetical protein
VHKKYTHHRNVVAFSTIFILIVISSLTFVRGIAWIQMVWHQNIFEDGDALLAISFFSWLCLLILVHVLFLRHTFNVEKKRQVHKVDGVNNQSFEALNVELDESNRSSLRRVTRKGPSFVAGLPKKPSHPCHLFDPRTHFKDGKCRFSDMSEFGSLDGGDAFSILTAEQHYQQKQNEESLEIEIDSNGLDTDTTDNGANAADSIEKYHDDTDTDTSNGPSAQRLPAWCEVFICFSPEYKRSSLLWKSIAWMKFVIITASHMLFLYFVIVCIGATTQAKKTIEKLPYVQDAIYESMNEGPVCAFDNRGSESNISTFADAIAAHDSGFFVLHCGACGACSTWENLILEWSTRDTISELANGCAQRGLFGGNDAITECLMDPSIGWKESCAKCWMEDVSTLAVSLQKINGCAHSTFNVLSVQDCMHSRILCLYLLTIPVH